MDTNRFTQKSLEALQAAQQLAQSYGNAQVEQVHLLDALLSQENGLIGQLMGKLGLNVQQVRTACESAVNRLPKISGSNQPAVCFAGYHQAEISGGAAGRSRQRARDQRRSGIDV